MAALFISLGILTTILLILLGCNCITNNELVLCGIFLLIAGICFGLALGRNIFKDAAKKEVYESVLKGEEIPYKMEIHYVIKDSLYVPIDTAFVEKM